LVAPKYWPKPVVTIYVGDDASPARITERVGDSISHCSTTVCKALRHQLGLTPRELHFSPQLDIPIVIASSTMSSSITPDQVGNSRLHDNARISHDRTGRESLRPRVLRQSKGQTTTAGANSGPSAPQGKLSTTGYTNIVQASSSRENETPPITTHSKSKKKQRSSKYAKRKLAASSKLPTVREDEDEDEVCVAI
jgi:hypothetical protein